MSKGGNQVPKITQAEHIGPDDTGDNIEAKRVASYVWDGANWVRMTQPGGSGGSTNANNTYGIAVGVAVSSTASVISIPSSTAGYKITGFVATGEGDGYFFVQINGSTIFSGHIDVNNKSEKVILPNPVSVSTGSVVDLKVTNQGLGIAAYEATLLGV